MSEQKIRVLIVDDSALMRKLLSDMLSADSRIVVVGLARDGEDAIKQINLLSPDVVTLDVEMPKKGGLAVLEELMRTRPIPVIMVSSLTQEGAQITLKALSLGCVDFVTKPSGIGVADVKTMREELISKVIVAKSAKVRPLSAFQARLSASFASVSFQRQSKRELVAIAASTGGPMALQQLLSKLPGNFPLPIVVTQHMPKDFTSSFAKRLDTLSNITVVEGEDGTSLEPACAVIAPGGSHLIVKRRPNGTFCCGLSDAPPVLSVKPSANIMFSSVAEEFGGKVICVVLTGMGKDGTEGAVALRAKGAYIIAESQETCVVYGMPKAVVEAGVADEVLPLPEIPDALLRCVRG